MKMYRRLLLAVPLALPHFVCAASPLTAEQLAAVTAIEESCDRIGNEDKAHRALEAMVNATPSSSRAHERASAQFKPAYENYVRALAQFSAVDLVKLCDSAASTLPSGTSIPTRSRTNGTSTYHKRPTDYKFR